MLFEFNRFIVNDEGIESIQQRVLNFHRDLLFIHHHQLLSKLEKEGYLRIVDGTSPYFVKCKFIKDSELNQILNSFLVLWTLDQSYSNYIYIYTPATTEERIVAACEVIEGMEIPLLDKQILLTTVTSFSKILSTSMFGKPLSDPNFKLDTLTGFLIHHGFRFTEKTNGTIVVPAYIYTAFREWFIYFDYPVELIPFDPREIQNE